MSYRLRGVFITGHVRSGTSMIAGLFREHGVFFGQCGGPTGDNAKGRVENVWLKRTLHDDEWPGPDWWFNRLRVEGWDGEAPWGAKLMPKWWKEMRETRPSVVVLCYRPAADILASCERVGWERSQATIEDRWRMMDAIESEYDGPVVSVWTPSVVGGDYSYLSSALDALDIDLDPDICNCWIDPELWHG